MRYKDIIYEKIAHGFGHYDEDCEQVHFQAMNMKVWSADTFKMLLIINLDLFTECKKFSLLDSDLVDYKVIFPV